mmetsp:Transcript_18401/g.50503  ORF Transcript_18401/g.50503 Transcript_18401/m.50503 type:complete len:206 (+) Transcript_18401:164-781(+)
MASPARICTTWLQRRPEHMTSPALHCCLGHRRCVEALRSHSPIVMREQNSLLQCCGIPVAATTSTKKRLSPISFAPIRRWRLQCSSCIPTPPPWYGTLTHLATALCPGRYTSQDAMLLRLRLRSTFCSDFLQKHVSIITGPASTRYMTRPGATRRSSWRPCCARCILPQRSRQVSMARLLTISGGIITEASAGHHLQNSWSTAEL